MAERIRGYATSRGAPVHYLSNGDLERAFRCYDAVIFVEALGGVVRLICPHLRDKEVDPSVLVVGRGGVTSSRWSAPTEAPTSSQRSSSQLAAPRRRRSIINVVYICG